MQKNIYFIYAAPILWRNERKTEQFINFPHHLYITPAIEWMQIVPLSRPNIQVVRIN